MIAECTHPRKTPPKICAMNAETIKAKKAGATAEVIYSVSSPAKVFFSNTTQYITNTGVTRDMTI